MPEGGTPPHTHTHTSQPRTLLQSPAVFVLSPYIFEIYSPLQKNTCRQQARRTEGVCACARVCLLQISTLCRRHYVCHFSRLTSKQRLLSLFFLKAEDLRASEGMRRGLFLLFLDVFFCVSSLSSCLTEHNGTSRQICLDLRSAKSALPLYFPARSATFLFRTRALCRAHISWQSS